MCVFAWVWLISLKPKGVITFIILFNCFDLSSTDPLYSKLLY